MAISQSLLTSGGSATNATSFTTASITPSSYKVVIVGVIGYAGSPADAVVSGCGLTWTKIDSQVYHGDSKVTLYWGVSGWPSTGELTISFGGQTEEAAMWVVTELTNCDVYDPIVQSAKAEETGNESSLTVTLGAFSSGNNGTLGMFGTEGSGYNISPGSGFTEIAETNFYDDKKGMQEFKDSNDTSVDATSGGSHKWGGIAVELNFNDNPPSASGGFLINFI